MTVVAFGLRIHALGVPNLTGDEWFMLRNHDQGPLWIIHQAHTFEPHPLLYYLGLAGWIELAGRSEFAMRFPSVAFGTVLVVASIGLGRAIIGPRAGVIAGAVVALNPYQIAEAQNARNYAMVVSLSAVASLLYVRALRRNRRRDWAAYGVAMFLALNTHYDAALVLMVHVAYGIVCYLIAARRGCQAPSVASVEKGAIADLPFTVSRDWIATTAVVAVLFVAWLLYAWPALLAYHGYFPASVSLRHVLTRSLATFSLGQTASIPEAFPAFGLAALGLVWLLVRRPRSATFLTLYTLLPILVVSVLFLVRPMFDERYLIVLAPGYLVILAAGLEGLWQVAAPIGIAGIAGSLVVLVPTIPRTYQTMLTDRTDYRSMAAWVSTDGTSSDPIVATGYGQSELFGYYYHGGRTVQVIDQPSALAAALPSLLKDHDGLWLLPYWQSPPDVAALDVLNRDAALAAQRWFVNARALYYASPSRLTRPSETRATWDDRLTLQSAALTDAEIQPGQAVAAEIRWNVLASLTTPKVSLRLLDGQGAPVAQSDLALADGASLAPGDRIFRIGLLTPPSLPPGAYQLAVLVYRPDNGAALKLTTTAPVLDGAVTLGSVQVGVRSQPVRPAEAGVDLVDAVAFPNGISLLGRDPLGPPRAAGSRLSFRILWRSDRPSLPDVTRSLSLEDDRGHQVSLVSGPVLPSFPTSRWSPGQILAERIDCQIPATTASGSYHLDLSVGRGARSVDLGTVVISGPVRSFTRPAVRAPIGARFGGFATLLGDRVDAPSARPGGHLDVTLIWSATGTADKSYTAFVHLVDPAGKIQGQIDRVPVDGTRATDGWVAGEYLTDSYVVPIAAAAPAGQYRLEVGLYDPKSGARVPVVTSAGASTDHVVVGTVQVAG